MAKFEQDGEVVTVGVEGSRPGPFTVKLGEEVRQVSATPVGAHGLVLRLGLEVHRVFVATRGDTVHVAVGGERHRLTRPAPRGKKRGGAEEGAASDQVTTPMPGKVIKVLVAEGDEVRKNQGLVIVEAMKMENEIKAHRDAVVVKVGAAVGDMVNPGDLLVELGDPAEE